MVVKKKYKKKNVKKTGKSKKKNNGTRVKNSYTSKKKVSKTSSKSSAKRVSSKISSKNSTVKKLEDNLLIDNRESIKINKIEENIILDKDVDIIDNDIDNIDVNEIDNTTVNEDVVNGNELVVGNTEDSLNTTINNNNEDKLLVSDVIVDRDKLEDRVCVDESFLESLNLTEEKKEIVSKKRKDKKTLLVMILVFIFVFILDAIFFPRLELIGDKEIIISYKDKYVEPGYKALVYKKDISDNIYVDSNVNNGVVGEYEINYYLKLLGLKLNKTRYVNIVDQDKPNILVDTDNITVCPNLRILPDINYSASDEYDGDITDLVIRKDSIDEIIFSVSDSSDNFEFKTIKVNRVDSEKPVIKLKGSSYMFIEYGNSYIEPGYEISDNCSQFANLKVKTSGTVGMNRGTYNITYEVSDESGNTSSVTRKVVVGDKMVDNGSVINGVIYLTFDDGPNYGTTDKILDILKREGIKATFFVTNRGPDNLIKRMYDEGHTVALHTATHEYSYLYSSIDNYFNDLNKVSDRVKRITGVDSKIIRFPGGSSNTISKNYKKGIMTELTSLVLNKGYRYYDWNIDSMDASSAKSGWDVYNNVISGLSGNRSNIVLMHDTKSITVNGLSDIIKYGKNNGYKFSKIDMNTYMVRHSVNN